MKTSLLGMSAVAGVLMLAATASAQNVVQAGCQSCQADSGVVMQGDTCYQHGACCHGGRCHALLSRLHVPCIRGRCDALGRLHQSWQGPEDNWHGQYYNTSYGAPVALVAPPTASLQSKWSWGVANTAVVPIYNQFGREYPGPASPGGWGAGYLPTPLHPASTDQFGVHYVRAPW